VHAELGSTCGASCAAPQEFNIEKLQLVEAEKQKIRKDYERKESQVDVKKKMCAPASEMHRALGCLRAPRVARHSPAPAHHSPRGCAAPRAPGGCAGGPVVAQTDWSPSEYSTQLNATRLKILAAREESMRSLVGDASAKLAAFASPASPAYKQLLMELVVQGCAAMEGAPVTVRCRQVDLAAVQEAAVKAKTKLGTGQGAVTVDTAAFLPPPPDAAHPDKASCLGGVVVGTVDGKIKVSNTLEERLHVAYQANAPSLRLKIFGASGGHLRT